MNLKEYLYYVNVPKATFAKSIGYSREALNFYLSHHHKVSDKFARAVELKSGGLVSYEEMIEYNRAGMADKKKKASERITPAMKEAMIEEISKCLCESCKKKLTKRPSKSKKIE